MVLFYIEGEICIGNSQLFKLIKHKHVKNQKSKMAAQHWRPETLQNCQLPYKTIMGKQQKICRFFRTFFTSTFLHQQNRTHESYVTAFVDE